MAAILHDRLDSWSGIGLIIAGMTHPGVGRAAHGLRRARLARELLPVGIAHSIVGGSAWEPTPWRAVQRAAWRAMGRAEAA